MKVTATGSFKSDIFRSQDEGKTWTKQTVPEIMKDYAADGIVRIYSAKTNKDEDRVTLYFLSYTNKLWVTSNAGESYEYFNNVPTGITRLITHDLYPGMYVFASPRSQSG